MKKFIRIIILTVILSSNAYAKIFSLNCTDSNDIYDKSELKVDTKKKEQQEELEKIKKYGETINQFTRDKNK